MTSPTPPDPSSLPSRISPSYAPPEESPSSDGSLSKPLSSYFKALSESAHRFTSGQIPCARNSLLYGVASMAVISGMGLVAGRKRLGALYWGVGGGMLVSCTSWEVCRRNRAAELQRMRSVIVEHNKKRQAGQTAAQGQVPSTQDLKAASASAAAASQSSAQQQEEPPLQPSRLFARK